MQLPIDLQCAIAALLPLSAQLARCNRQLASIATKTSLPLAVCSQSPTIGEASRWLSNNPTQLPDVHMTHPITKATYVFTGRTIQAPNPSTRLWLDQHSLHLWIAIVMDRVGNPHDPKTILAAALIRQADELRVTIHVAERYTQRFELSSHLSSLSALAEELIADSMLSSQERSVDVETEQVPTLQDALAILKQPFEFNGGPVYVTTTLSLTFTYLRSTIRMADMHIDRYR